jgi:hypothetical protein
MFTTSIHIFGWLLSHCNNNMEDLLFLDQWQVLHAYWIYMQQGQVIFSENYCVSWACLLGLLNFILMEKAPHACFFSKTQTCLHCRASRLLCGSNHWFRFQLINHLSLCSRRISWVHQQKEGHDSVECKLRPPQVLIPLISFYSIHHQSISYTLAAPKSWARWHIAHHHRGQAISQKTIAWVEHVYLDCLILSWWKKHHTTCVFLLQDTNMSSLLSF